MGLVVSAWRAWHLSDTSLWLAAREQPGIAVWASSRVVGSRGGEHAER